MSVKVCCETLELWYYKNMNPEKIRPRYNSEPQPKIPANFKQFISKMTLLATDNSERVAGKANKLSKKDKKYAEQVFAQVRAILSKRPKTKEAKKYIVHPETPESELFKKLVKQNIANGDLYSNPKRSATRFAHSQTFIDERNKLLSEHGETLPRTLSIKDEEQVGLIPPKVRAHLETVIEDMQTLAGNKLECYELIGRINQLALERRYTYAQVNKKTNLIGPADYNGTNESEAAQRLNEQGYYLWQNPSNSVI